MKPTASLLAAALVLALAACNNQDPANDTTGLSVDSTVTAQGPDHAGRDADAGDAAGLAEGDRTALRSVAELDRHIAAAAETALGKNVGGDVRAFAEALRDTHTRNLVATRNLLDSGVTGSYAATAGDTAAVTGSSDPQAPRGDAAGALAPRTERTEADEEIDLPLTAESRALRERYTTARTRMSALDGDAFTSAWLTAMVEDHEAALAELDDTSIPAAADEDVARHLQQTRTAIAEHLDTARALQTAR